jgi:hypothetical protein
MLVSMKLLHRSVIHTAIGCVFALALCGPVFSQSIECPVSSNTTVSGDTTLFTGATPTYTCVVGNNAVLSVPNGTALLNQEGLSGKSTTMILDSGTTLQNSGYVQNFATTSTAYVGGTLTNFGTIYNNSSGTLDTTDGTLTNAGNLENFGTLDDETGGGGTLNNAGRLVNEFVPNTLGMGGVINVTTITNTFGASIQNDGNLYTSSLTNNGTLTNGESTLAGGSITISGMSTNNGTLTNQTYGTINVYGSLENNGTLTDSAPNPTDILSTGGTINLYGSLLNNSNGMLTNSGVIALASGASLTNQGSLSNAGASISLASGSSLTNQGSLLNTGGTLSIAAGSTLNNLAGGTITQNSSAFNFGLMLVDGTLNSAAGSTLNPLSDTVVVNGTINSVPAVQLQDGDLFGTGTINGNVSTTGEAIFPETYNPGSTFDTGTLTINGNLSLSGALFIDMSGTAPGNYSILDVSGLVSLDSPNAVVAFDALNGFTPVTGDVFTFLNFGSLSGDFNFSNFDFSGWSCPTGDSCDLVYGANSVSLDILAASSSGGGGSTNTPEPSSLLLLSAAVIALVACSRAKRAPANT